MFGIDDNAFQQGASNKQQYGRNQQYGKPTNQQNQGGVLKFDEDSDSDDNTKKQPMLNTGGFSQSSTNFKAPFENQQDRPTTGSKLNYIEKQRQIMLNKQKAGIGNSQGTMVLNKKPGSEYSYGQNIDINFDQLGVIVNKDNSSGMYEPGSLNLKGTGLQPLTSANKVIKFDDKEADNKFINIEDSDEETENIINKQKLIDKKKEEQPNKTEPPQQPKQETNTKEQQNQFLKGIYGGSSDESEEEEAQAHQKMLQNEQQGNTIKEDDEDATDASAPVGSIQQPLTDAQQQQAQAQQNEPLQKTVVQNFKIIDMKSFLTRPLPKGMIFQTTIKRDKSGFSRFYPKYHVQFSSGQGYLLTGKKRSGSTSNYIMSMSKTDFNKKSQNFLGKVRSNFLGTEFHVFDTGCNPKKCKGNIAAVRSELGAVIYESNLLGSRGPRKMRVIIPSMQPNSEPITYKPLTNNEGMLAIVKSGRQDGLFLYHNKPPKWNDSVQAFVLNFNGRVDRPSVKNFQLIDDKDDENILLQFGRIGDDSFNMDVSYPFSIIQAFGVILSSFDYKIACE